MVEPAEIAVATVYSILIIVNIVGNSLVCAIIKRNREMRTPINYLFVNLAVADMLVAAFFAPMRVFIHMFTHPQGVAGTVLCKLVTGGAFTWIGAASSVFTLVVISVERYYTVAYPHGRKRNLNNNKLKVIIPASWIFGLIIYSPGFPTMKFDKNMSSCILVWPEQWMGKAYSMLCFLVFGVLPIPLMVALYSKVVYHLWFKRNENNELSRQQKVVIRMRKRSTLMAVTVSIIFSICWFTDTLMYLLSYYSNANPPGKVTYDIGFILVLFNSAVNPYIYALISQRFREKFKRMLCCTVGDSRVDVAPSQGRG